MAVKKSSTNKASGAMGILAGIKAIKSSNLENRNTSEDTSIIRKQAKDTLKIIDNNVLSSDQRGHSNEIDIKSPVENNSVQNSNNTTTTEHIREQQSKFFNINNEIATPEVEDFTMKRSYALKPSTYLKLQELKVFDLAKIKLEYANLNYNDIVDMAICQFYDNVKDEIKRKKVQS